MFIPLMQKTRQILISYQNAERSAKNKRTHKSRNDIDLEKIVKKVQRLNVNGVLCIKTVKQYLIKINRKYCNQLYKFRFKYRRVLSKVLGRILKSNFKRDLFDN